MTTEKESSPTACILQFACDCVSHLQDSYRDPWSYVTRAGLISSETKEIILNKTYRQPKTVTQLAKEIGLSQPAIYKHVQELLDSDMLREVDLPSGEKAYRVERYYTPNFPVLLQDDVTHFEASCRKVADHITRVYWEHRHEFQQAFNESSLEERGFNLEDVLDYLYSRTRRMARQILEEQGFFPELPLHRDGSRWVYWAEEVALEPEPDQESEK